VLDHGLGTVKYTACDDIWSSSKDPAVLEHDYARSKDASSGVLLWVGRLIEIFADVFRVANLPPPPHEQVGDIEAQEQALEDRLRSWYRSLPLSLWVLLGDDFEMLSVEAGDPAASIKSDGGLNAFFLFHAAVCLLMRRCFMRFLRHVSARLCQQLWDTSPSKPFSSPPLPQQDERAFKVALEAARAMASCIRAQRLANAFLHRLPFGFVFISLHVLLTLFDVEGLPVAGLDSPLVPELSPLASPLDAPSGIYLRMPSTDVAAVAAVTGDVSDTETTFRPLDEFFFLYRRMSATSKIVSILLQIIEGLRAGVLPTPAAALPLSLLSLGSGGGIGGDIDPDRLLDLANRAPPSLRQRHRSRVASRSALRDYTTGRSDYRGSAVLLGACAAAAAAAARLAAAAGSHQS
ncbi:hypothetical protein HK405_011528, partial [Cladochytrium tenue]